MLHATQNPCVSRTKQSFPAKIDATTRSALMAPAVGSQHVTIFEDDRDSLRKGCVIDEGRALDIPHATTMARPTPFHNSDIITTGGGVDFSEDDIEVLYCTGSVHCVL